MTFGTNAVVLSGNILAQAIITVYRVLNPKSKGKLAAKPTLSLRRLSKYPFRLATKETTTNRQPDR